MRNLMASPAGRVSRWMSLAPTSSASRRVERTRRTTSLDSSPIALSDRSSMRPLSAGPGRAPGASTRRRARAATPRGAARKATRSPRCARHQLNGSAMRSSAQACSSPENGSSKASSSRAVGGAQQRAAALRAFGEGQQVERRRRARSDRAMVSRSRRERAGEARGERVRLAARCVSSSTSTRRRRAAARGFARLCDLRRRSMRHCRLPGELEDRHVHEHHDGADDQADRSPSGSARTGA